MDLAAEQVRQLAADREAEAGSTVLAAGAGIGLLERLEDDLLLLERDADAGIGHFERDYGRRLAQHRMIGAPAAERQRHVEAHAAVLGELEGVREQILEYLLQALGIGSDAAAEMGIDLNVEGQLSRIRLMAERARHHVEEIREKDLLGVDR